MKDKKYILTEETKEVDGHILHRIQAIKDFGRIQAIKDFGCIKAGDLGGWVEKEENLSHEGVCWVYGNAQVYGDAKVCGDAEVSGDARVFDDAEVYGDAQIYGYARVHGNAQVYDDARVFGNARVCGYAKIYTGDITSTQDYLVVGPIGSRNDFTTFFKANGTIMISCGCFKGTIEKFEEKVMEKYPNGIYFQQYTSACFFAKANLI